MRFEEFSFGSIRIDGVTYEHDVLIDCGEVRERKKKPSKKTPRRLRSYAAIGRRADTVEMRMARDRHWNRRDERGKARRQAPENQSNCWCFQQAKRSRR